MKELSDGVCLCSKEELMEDQKTWDESDNAKKFDFSTSDFWWVTDDGICTPADCGVSND